MDPLSIAASVAGLLSLAGGVAQLSRELYSLAKKKPDGLIRLAERLDSFRAVLDELEDEYQFATADTQAEQRALTAVSKSCEETLRQLQGNLLVLRGILSQNIWVKLSSRSQFNAVMENVREACENLEAFKLTLSIALQLRCIKLSGYRATSSEFPQLRIEVNDLLARIQRPGISQPLHPIQQYMHVSSTTLRQLTTGAENVGSFDGFEDWLASMAPKAGGDLAHPTPPVERLAKVTLSGVPGPRERNFPTKSTKIQVNVRNVQGSSRAGAGVRFQHRVGGYSQAGGTGFGLAIGHSESIELTMTDYLHQAIEALKKKGYKQICGFRFRNELIGPTVPATYKVPVYVSDEPSSYSLDWLQINKDEPLEQFYDTYARGGGTAKPLVVSKPDNVLVITDKHFRTSTAISLNRTLKVPDDESTYELPALFDQFPMVNVEGLRGKLPKPMVQKSGLLVPVYQREAVSLGFLSMTEFFNVISPQSQSLAVRVLAGGVNVVSPLPTSGPEDREEQDYIIAPGQNRLDGFLWTAENSRGVVRQFVAMPTGGEYSAEAQVTGEEFINGIQLVIAPPLADDGMFQLETKTGSLPVSPQKSPTLLGLKAGARLSMTGKEVGPRYLKDHLSVHDPQLYTQGQAFRHYQDERIALSKMRPVRIHEALPSVLQECAPFDSLELEAVYAMNITVQSWRLDSIYYHSYPPLGAELIEFTWKVSPFMPTAILRDIVKAEFEIYGEVTLFRRGQTVNACVLHEFCSEGDILTCSELDEELHPCGFSGRLGLDVQSVPEEETVPVVRPEVSKWEMGIALGGRLYQDVLVDRHTRRWNWAKSQLINIQFLNAVAFQAFTGLTPPQPPISFAAYVDAGIPFYHILPKSNVLTSDIVPKLKSISETDLQKGIVKSDALHGLKPVQCVICERKLADTVLRPCNHIFCFECVESRMGVRHGVRCSACMKIATHTVRFSAPMEMPRLPQNPREVKVA